ncbi:MAG TPA: NAD(P)/FAD-dependent oxidoreductase [Thermoleophilaceae bacterium]|jgi:cation diffusion facilitator CzcD-associated flavoprotein CzcO
MSSEHVDVLIVGAGLSGVGAACHLREHCPQKTFAILEARDAIGGTWDLFRYPGIRSDSDMYTLGYSFRPWEDPKAIADGPAIRSYVRETARDHGVEEAIRFHHRVVRAEWSSEDARWSVEAERTDTGEQVSLTCSFLYGCTGYYRYDQGFLPDFEGTERFEGTVVHPQHWPEGLDYAGKRVVVIGSGATAVTLVPAMAREAAHVTMLQRSPSYVVTLPAQDPIANFLRRRLPSKAAYSLVRWKNVLLTMASFQLSRRRPELMKQIIRKGLLRHLPAGYEVDVHFKPTYNPWEQRLCLVPDSDLFEVLADGRASVVTDTIETFTETGLRLSSGAELEADLIVTATGLNVSLFGDIDLTVDGDPVEFGDRIAYKGMMVCGVPNFAMALGYTNASWTLKCDLIAHYVCRLLNHMDACGYAIATPQPPGPSVATEPFIDFSSGYVLRAIDKLPKQGATSPWRLHQNWFRDVRLLKRGPVDDSIEFSNPVPERQPLRQAA